MDPQGYYDYIHWSPAKKTQDSILSWAKEKGIFDKSSAFIQTEKLEEECKELYNELADVERSKRKGLDGDAALAKENSKIELGDCLVVLTIIAHMLDSDLEECYQLAYDKISKRTGTMINGVFVKDEQESSS